MIFVGSQIGWNSQQFRTDDFIAQTAQALRNVLAVLQAGGAGRKHMVRMTWYIVDRVRIRRQLRNWARLSGSNGPQFPGDELRRSIAACGGARAKVEDGEA